MKRIILAFLLLSAVWPVAAQKTAKPLRVACVGNSVTYGMRLADREHDCYPAQLQGMLGSGYEVGNFGHSGSTLLFNGYRPYVKTEEFRKALDFKGDLVVIHLGLNDTDPRCWPEWKEEFIPNYRALIDSFRTANPKARIWICKMTPIFHTHSRFESGTRDWHAQIQERIEQIARTTPGVELIDFYTPLHPHPEMFPDALHPNPDGARILAQTVYGHLTGDYGGLQLPVLYGDHMVLQSGQAVKLRGKADKGEVVTVKLFSDKDAAKAAGDTGKGRNLKPYSETHKATAQSDGTWEATFSAHPAEGPFRLTFETKEKRIELKDVWFGEVWLCSGQSNMEFTVGQTLTASEDLKEAANPLIHLFNMPAKARTDNVEWTEDVLRANNMLDHLSTGPWQLCSPEAVKPFSSVAYHFGRVLADSLQVHVGIICNAVGGTTTEAWVDRTTLENEFPKILYDWTNNDLTQAWARGRARKNNARATNPLQRHPYEPAYMFEAGIEPLQHYAIRGVTWYQGESNADRLEVHARLFPLLERSWRTYWDNAQLPFYTVQLSSLNRHHFPQFRDSQRRLARSLPDTWLVVTTDLGDSLDVHYRMKRPVGERLAAQALRHTYGRDIVSEGPVLREARQAGQALELRFANAEGMTVTRGFEVAGDDGLFHAAEARIDGERIVLSSKAVKRPTAVRYGWEPFTRADLRNAAGFPASTFIKEGIR